MKPVVKGIVVLLMLALLSACGVRTVYNNLDRFVLRWVDNQLSLDAEQTDMARALVRQQIDWHCASELPDYAAWLRQVDDDLADGRITVERLQAHADVVTGFGERLLVAVQPAMVDLLARLDDEQVKQLAASFAERNDELAERAALDAEDRRTESLASMERGLRRFLGRLDADQRQRLEQWADDLMPAEVSRLERRLEWQQQFLLALEGRHRPEFDRELAALFDSGPRNNAKWDRIETHNRQRTFEALVDLHDLAGDRQRNRLRSRVAGLADDFERLSCT